MIAMIFIGTMNVRRTDDRGFFDCPSCGQEQEYRLRGSRPFLTIYFVPLIPIGERQQYVECVGCRGSFDPIVLDSSETLREHDSEGEFRSQLQLVMMLATISDGHISDKEIAGLQYLSKRLVAQPVDREELGQLCSDLRQRNYTLENYVAVHGKHWTQSQRQVAVQAMFLAASAEGDLSEPQSRALRRAAAILGVEDDEFRGAITDAIRWWESN